MTNNNGNKHGELLPPANDKRATRRSDLEWLKLQANDSMTYTNLPQANPTKDVTSGLEVEGLDEGETYTVLRDSEHVAELERQQRNVRSSAFPLATGRQQELVSSYYKTKLGLPHQLLHAEVHGDVSRKDPDLLTSNPYKFYNRKPFPSFIKEPHCLSIDVKVVGVEEELKYGGDLTRWRTPVVDDTDDFKYEYLKSIALRHPLVAVEKWSAISDECVVMLVKDYYEWTEEEDRNKKRYRGYNSGLTHAKWVDYLKKEEHKEGFFLKGFRQEFAEYVTNRQHKELFTLLTKQPHFMTPELIELACMDITEEHKLNFLRACDGSGKDKVSEDVEVLAMFGLTQQQQEQDDSDW